MAGTTVLRVEKIKSFKAAKDSKAHIARNMDTPNADPNKLKLNKTLIGHEDTLSQIKGVYEKKGIKVRKNAVIAYDGLISLSPEAFDNVDSDKFGDLSAQFLKDEFKGRVIFAEMHLDEKTPHIHFTMLPIVDNKLNARKYMDVEKLGGMQKRFYQFMSENLPEAELEPPKHGQKAKHTTVQDFYRQIENNMDTVVAKISERLEEELLARAELSHDRLLNVLDEYVKASFLKKKDDVKDQLSTFYKELRGQIKDLSVQEREDVKGFASGETNDRFVKSVLKAITKEVIEGSKDELKEAPKSPSMKI